MTPGSDSDMDSRTGTGLACALLVDLVAEDPQWTALGDHDAAAAIAEVTGAITANLELPAPRTTATIALGSDAEVRELNKAWRGKDKPTNVLSFPSPPPPKQGRRIPMERFLGDVILAEETLAREAADLGIAAIDHFRHLVLHGLLHLLGYDHESETEATVMEALETKILASIGVADPYAGAEMATAAPSPVTPPVAPHAGEMSRR